MTLTLTVDAAVWNRHVDSLAARVPGLVPVVKGNGYGFGRAWLADRAATVAPLMAVGTVHEVDEVPSNYPAVVLTPTLDPPPHLRDNAVLTVGAAEHLHAAATSPASRPGINRQVLVKVRSSMNRYGFDAHHVPTIMAQSRELGLRPIGVSIHPPLHGSSSDHRREIESLVRVADESGLDPTTPVWVSHVDPDDFAILRSWTPARPWYLRLGTALWHGDKSMLWLHADTIDVVPVRAGTLVGYHGTVIESDGHLVMVGCGSAHGVTPLADGRSPFHFRRQRLTLLETPHMHTSMCFFPESIDPPRIGDEIDVQRPLTTTAIDCIRWN